MQPTSHYVLKPPTPTRAYQLAAVLAVPGLLLIIVALVAAWPKGVLVLGVLVFFAGLFVALFALASVSRLAVHVELDDNGYRVRDRGRDKRGSWLDVSKVMLTPDGSRLAISHGQVERTHIHCPGGVSNSQMEQLVEDIAARLRRRQG